MKPNEMLIQRPLLIENVSERAAKMAAETNLTLGSNE
jgi:hypothetical protein